MTALIVGICLSAAIGSTDAASSDASETKPVDALVRDAIAAFQPFWYPPAGDLRGAVIGIDPLPPAEADAPADPAMVTAAYLYHHIGRAGGRAVLTRRERPVAGFDPADRAGEVRNAQCQVYVTLRYAAGTTEVTVNVPGNHPAAKVSARLANSLAAALDGSEVRQADSDDSVAAALSREHVIPGCTVRLPLPADDARPTAAGPVYQQHAKALYAGLREFLKPEDAPERAPAEQKEEEGDADRLVEQKPSKHGRLARGIWPTGQLPADQLDWFCDRFAGSSITNRSLVYFEVTARLEGEAVVLHGATNTPIILDGLTAALAAVGRPVDQCEVRVLPDAARLGHPPFGVAQAVSALTFNRPSEQGGLQTQLLFGEPLYLLDRADGFYLAHAGDGYWGWVREEAVRVMEEQAFAAYLAPERVVIVRDQRTGGALIPRGATLPLLKAEGEQCTLMLPDGKSLTLPEAAVRRAANRDERIAQQVEAALGMLYSPYIFGGRSPFGLDCSGLVTSLSAHGLDDTARDAWHQVFDGRLSATRWHRDEMRAGDFVYFIDPAGKVYHAGMAISPTHVLHSAPPGVQVGSFDRNDRLYDRRIDRDFFMAKRR